MRRINRDDSGNIILVVLIGLVATGLIVSSLVLAESGMRRSRRAGDSANALQLADAGVNHAVRAVANQPGPTYDPAPVAVPGAGTYDVSATLDPAQAVWHIDSVGQDATGVRRRVRADAVGETLFGNALFAKALLNVPSGASVDSFQSGANLAAMCTRNGIVGTNTPADMTFGNSGGGSATRNCVESTYGISWPHPVDGCTSYGDGSQTLPATGSGKCPASTTKKENFVFDSGTVTIPAGLPTLADSFVCDAAHPIPGGRIWYWRNVTMRPGCRVDVAANGGGPAIIYTDGPVDIGAVTGADRNINPPLLQSDGGPCPNYAGTDSRPSANPASYYCPGWSSNLRLYVASTSGTFKFRNGTKFWGVIVAPNRPVDADGNGNPQVEMWGAIITSASDANAQFALHYDDSLGGITTGRFRVRNWREEPSR